jgi:sec-independent protein translocase protein TatA
MEWTVVIVAIILLPFGAKRIPELTRSIGRATGEFERGKRLVEMDMLRAERDPDAPFPSKARGDAVPETAGPPNASPIHKAALEFGLTTEGRSDQELKELIGERVTGE